jgi:hypothetical protein
MDNNFEIKRQQMMKELSRRKRESVVNRKVATMQKQNNEQLSISPVQHVQKKKISVYGADCFFIKNFLNTLRLTNETVFNSDVDKLIEMVLDGEIGNIAIDLDDPTDWRKSVDVFTNVKTLKPDALFYICTKDPEWVQAKTLEKQGGVIVKKPVDFDFLYKILK